MQLAACSWQLVACNWSPAGEERLGLLSAKKVIYAANVLDADLAEGNPMVEKVREHAKAEGSSCVIVSAQV